jgi:hypothetical protein
MSKTIVHILHMPITSYRIHTIMVQWKRQWHYYKELEQANVWIHSKTTASILYITITPSYKNNHTSETIHYSISSMMQGHVAPVLDVLNYRTSSSAKPVLTRPPHGTLTITQVCTYTSIYSNGIIIFIQHLTKWLNIFSSLYIVLQGIFKHFNFLTFNF